MDPHRTVAAFIEDMTHDRRQMTRASTNRTSIEDARPCVSAHLSPLLAGGRAWNPVAAEALVSREIIALLPGDPWKHDDR